MNIAIVPSLIVSLSFQLDFDAIIGKSYTSDIALDDLGYQEFRYMSSDECMLTPSCANPNHQPPTPPEPATTAPPYPPYTTSPPYTRPPYTYPPITNCKYIENL